MMFNLLNVLEWYLPWSSLDVPLKVMAVVWVASVFIGLFIYIYNIVLGRPWLSMNHMAMDVTKAEEQDAV